MNNKPSDIAGKSSAAQPPARRIFQHDIVRVLVLWYLQCCHMDDVADHTEINNGVTTITTIEFTRDAAARGIQAFSASNFAISENMFMNEPYLRTAARIERQIYQALAVLRQMLSTIGFETYLADADDTAIGNIKRSNNRRIEFTTTLADEIYAFVRDMDHFGRRPEFRATKVIADVLRLIRTFSRPPVRIILSQKHKN